MGGKYDIITSMKKMVLVFPHPDDESFVTGGTVAKYASSGWDVEYVCATRGEAGNRGPLENSLETTGDLRQKELDTAIKILGIRRVTFLGYKDGLLSKIVSGELEETMYKVLRERNPNIVITYEPNGVSNHPDHKRLTIATTYAFQKYVRSILLPKRLHRKLNGRYEIPEKYITSAEESTMPKLYYSCLPESAVAHFQQVKVFPQISFGEPMRGVTDEKITTIIDISRFIKKKAEALSAHKTQKADVDRFLSIDSKSLFVNQEYFMLRMIGTHEHFIGKHDRVSDRL